MLLVLNVIFSRQHLYAPTFTECCNHIREDVLLLEPKTLLADFEVFSKLYSIHSFVKPTQQSQIEMLDKLQPC